MSAAETPATGSRVFEVLDSDTALAVGSGSLAVLATPRLLAWMEQVAVIIVDPGLPAGRRTVGTHVDLDHVAAAGVGARVTVRAEVSTTAGRRVQLSARATDSTGAVLATAQLTRIVVDHDEFLARLG